MNRFFNEENLRTLSSSSERTDCVDNALRAVGIVTSNKNLGSVELN